MLARSRPGDGEMLGLLGPAYALLGSPGGLAEPGRVRTPGDLGRPTLPQPLGAEVPDAVEQPVAHLAAGRDVEADQRAVDQPADHVDGRGSGTSSAPRTCSTAASGAPPEKQASAHRPRWSSGNSRS